MPAGRPHSGFFIAGIAGVATITPELPEEFAALAPFAAHWAQASEPGRYQARIAADMAQIEAFYAAMQPRMEAVIGHLNRQPLDGLGPAQRNLLHLAQAFMEAAMAVERFRSPRVPGGFDPERFLINDRPATARAADR